MSPPGSEAPPWRPGDALQPLRELVAAGGVLAIPTESSYGLGVDPRNPEGVERIYRLKGRPASKALPVVAADLSQVIALGVDPELPELSRLGELWPAPLTAVLPVATPLPAAPGMSTLAVRIPEHPALRSLLGALGTPLTATSANRSGESPVLKPEDAGRLLGDELGRVVDGGILHGGPPSTLIRWRGEGWEVIRRGRFDVEEGSGRRMAGEEREGGA